MFNLNRKTKKDTETNHLSDFKNKYSQLLPDSKISRVLIADEEREVRDALSVAVRRWAQDEYRNVEIIIVNNGQKAVDYVKTQKAEEMGSVILALSLLIQSELYRLASLLLQKYQKMSQKNPPFLAILDLRMPEMNGLETAEIIHELCPKMPIIITASHNEIDEKLIQKADEFANKNTHMGFVIRTNSSHLLKVALEFEIAKLELDPEEQEEYGDFDLLENLKDKLSELLN